MKRLRRPAASRTDAAPRLVGSKADRSAAVYSERLDTPWWWYPVALGIAALLAAEFRVAGLELTVWIPFGVLLPFALAIVWSLGRSRLVITGDELRIRDAHLPLSYISGIVGLDAKTLRLVVGREGDPAAFVTIRAWIGPGVQLWLDDPDDPTPYWVLSTRHPAAVVALVRAQIAERDSPEHEPPGADPPEPDPPEPDPPEPDPPEPDLTERDLTAKEHDIDDP